MVGYIFAVATAIDRALIVESSTTKGCPMKSVLIPFTAVLVLSSGVALAADQPQRSSSRAACKADVEKLCSGTQPGGGRIVGCLKQNEAQVSPACKDALAKAQEKKAAPAPAAPKG